MHFAFCRAIAFLLKFEIEECAFEISDFVFNMLVSTYRTLFIKYKHI